MAEIAYPNIRTTIFSNLPQLADQWFKRHFDRNRLSGWKIQGTDSADLSWLKDKFIIPVLRLLGEYIGTGKSKYLALYLDERLRYAPHRMSRADRVQFFQELLTDDERQVLSFFEPGSKEHLVLSSLLKNIHAPLLDCSKEPALEVLALGDCLMNEVRIFFSQKCRELSFNADMRSIYFSGTENEELSVNEAVEYLSKNKVDAIAISFFTFDGMRSFSRLMREYPKLSDLQVAAKIDEIIYSVRAFLLSLREHTQVPFLINSPSGLPLSRARKHLPFLASIPARKQGIINKINAALADVIYNVPNCIRVYEQSLTHKYGLRNMAADIVPRWLRKDAFFHTSAFGEKLAEEYARYLWVLKRLGKTKVLLVDFDNTLWHGVMADGRVVHYVDKQDLLLNLKKAGILLVAVSKNSPENIRWEEMILKREDFVLHKINWNMKALSVKEVAEELNLGLDSFVLIDDNPAERALVSQELPQVQVMDALNDDTWEDLRLMLKFPNTQETEEAKKRTQMYQEQVKRQTVLKGALDYPQMMKTLQLKMLFRKANTSDLARLYELINRTNQFNTTTIRYSKAEIKAYLEHPLKTIWVAELEDKFGALGIVGTMLTTLSDKKWCHIESFVMSCRAMGYRVEQQMLAELSLAQGQEVKGLVGIYRETAKNGPCRSLYKSCGFEPVLDETWEFSLNEGARVSPVAWIEVEKV